MIGGYGTLDDVYLDPLATTEAIDPSTEPATLTAGPNITARGELCAVGLPDGRVITLGGRTLDDPLAPSSDPSVEVITPTSTGAGATLGMEPLAMGRHLHTCTLLKDGTVLVVGGVHESGGISTVLPEALIYTPAPRE